MLKYSPISTFSSLILRLAKPLWCIKSFLQALRWKNAWRHAPRTFHEDYRWNQIVLHSGQLLTQWNHHTIVDRILLIGRPILLREFSQCWGDWAIREHSFPWSYFCAVRGSARDCGWSLWVRLSYCFSRPGILSQWRLCLILCQFCSCQLKFLEF